MKRHFAWHSAHKHAGENIAYIKLNIDGGTKARTANIPYNWRDCGQLSEPLESLRIEESLPPSLIEIMQYCELGTVRFNTEGDTFDSHILAYFNPASDHIVRDPTDLQVQDGEEVFDIFGPVYICRARHCPHDHGEGPECWVLLDWPKQIPGDPAHDAVRKMLRADYRVEPLGVQCNWGDHGAEDQSSTET